MSRVCGRVKMTDLFLISESSGCKGTTTAANGSRIRTELDVRRHGHGYARAAIISRTYVRYG